MLLSLDGPLHDEEPGQQVNEDPPHPGRHQVGLRGPEVDVEDDHGDADAEGVEDHGEQDELAQQRNDQGGGRDDLGQQEEEHGEGEEDGDGEGDLLSAVRRKVEDQHSEEANAHAWDDEVDCVEQGLPPHGDVEGDVQVGLVTAGVELDISREK